MSRTLEDIVQEAGELISSGVWEIHLLGQDITRWGEGTPGGDLVRLVEAPNDLPGKFRIRLLYLHPARLDEKLIGLIASGNRVCPYVDMPIQHASDRVLKRMNRNYRRKRLEEIYHSLRRNVPGVSLRTTVMVGHPGEGQADFSELLDFIRGHPFENMGAFIYSPEPGTVSAGQGDLTERGEAEERHHRLMTAQAEISRGLWANRLGEMTETLILSTLDRSGERHTGKTLWQAPDVDGIISVSGRASPGDLARVRITGSSEYDLEGVIQLRQGR